MFRKWVKNFGPEWGAAVMGTAAISITLQLASETFRPFSMLLYLGAGYFLLTAVLFCVFLIPWTLRFFMYPDDVKSDLNHPIRGNFFPTMPISFILAGTGCNKLGPMLLGPSASYYLGVVFFFLGSIGIFLFGFLLIRSQFMNRNIRHEHANFAWFIPPVSHLIIPVLGSCSMDVHWANTPLSFTLFAISMIALGVGTLNFIFVGAAIWHRYIFTDIPKGKLAPTTMVSIAPTAIMVIFLMKFLEAIEASHGQLFGLILGSLLTPVKLISFALWGYSLWWLIMALILFHAYISMKDHPFAFGWWAYTFPLEAFAVATGLLSKYLAASLLQVLLLFLNVMAVVIWATVVFGTIRWLDRGEFGDAQY